MREQFTISKAAPQYYAVTVALAAAIGAAANPMLIMDDDGEFLLHSFLAWTNQDAALTANTQGQLPDNFTVRVQIQSGGRYLMSEPVHRSIICGVGNKFLGPEMLPIRFPKKTQLLFEFANTTAVATNLQFVLRGYKMFQGLPVGGPSPTQ